MANFTLSFSLLCYTVLLFSFNRGRILAQDVSFAKTWCVAKPSAVDADLENNVEFVCNQVGIDCSIIQEGGQCYYPASLVNHASVVMDLYFQKAGRSAFNCDSSKTGLLAVTDPSYGGCLYPFV
ncbi:major pollen allergen Ole e 10-like [Chenopodium quinoa]|uniref:major pollen allergen Ole e 10-like n=1 Tax=Chenopodium quinoa TaxID=63459 RepID=UPI000B78713C|nr:major pollen allergen Ole e 10-like [Chenopodium quinoa]